MTDADANVSPHRLAALPGDDTLGDGPRGNRPAKLEAAPTTHPFTPKVDVPSVCSVCDHTLGTDVHQTATAAPSGRVFVAGSEVEAMSYQRVTEHMRVPPDVVAGLDLLCDDGMPADKAAPLLMAAHRDGKDAEAFARHVLKLRKAIRPASGDPSQPSTT